MWIVEAEAGVVEGLIFGGSKIGSILMKEKQKCTRKHLAFLLISIRNIKNLPHPCTR